MVGEWYIVEWVGVDGLPQTHGPVMFMGLRTVARDLYLDFHQTAVVGVLAPWKSLLRVVRHVDTITK